MSSGTGVKHSYYGAVQEQLSLTVAQPLNSLGQSYSENANAGVSASVNAVDTGIKVYNYIQLLIN